MRKSVNPVTGRRICVIISLVMAVSCFASLQGNAFAATEEQGAVTVESTVEENAVGESVQAVNIMVKFNANGGTKAPGSINAVEGDIVVIPSKIPQKSGSTFKGWAMSSNAKKADFAAGSSFVAGASNVTLYAVWEKNDFTKLSKPVISTISAVTGCKAELTWEPVENADHYQVFRYNNGKWSKMTTVTGTTATVQGIHNKSLKYRIRAYGVNAKGSTIYSAYSAAKKVKTVVKMGQACKGETGVIGGQPGDQTGNEVKVSNYSYKASESSCYHWTYVIRITDSAKREKFASTIEAACKSSYVGYDMGRSDRITFYKEMEKVGFDITKLKTPCETSCTRLALTGLASVGIELPYNPNWKDCNGKTPQAWYDYDSEQLRDAVKAAIAEGAPLKIYTAKSYYSTYKNLQPGDILSKDFPGTRKSGHTAVVL